MIPPMKIIIGLSLIALASSLFEDREVCRKFLREGLKVCYKSATVTRVTELNSLPNKSLRLQLYPPPNHTISPYAFNNTSHMKNILLTFLPRNTGSSQSHTSLGSLSILSDSFAGLSGLEALALNNVTINFNNNNPLAPLSSLKMLVIKGSNLTEVPIQGLVSLPNLEWLDLGDNQIRSIRSNSFASQKSLQFLFLSHNGITYIEPGAFNGLSGLRKLVLSHNGLTVSPGMFQGTPKLLELDLQYAFGSNETHLQVGMFEGLPALYNLTLVGNKFGDVPTEVFHDLTSLKYLDLRDNEIRKITPGAFDRLSLDELDLFNNKIDVIETDTFNGIDLHLLDLARNDIRELKPRAFNGLTLDTLHLQWNKLTKIGRHDFDGFNTSYLGLWENNIQVIEENAFGDVVTGKLDLRMNPIAPFMSHAKLGLSESVRLLLVLEDPFYFKRLRVDELASKFSSFMDLSSPRN